MLHEYLPMKPELLKQAKELGAEKVILEFQGGSDEGYLNVYLQMSETGETPRDKFLQLTWQEQQKQREDKTELYQEYEKWFTAERNLVNDIEEWAWEVYEYSGAGDGSDYGDTVAYSVDGKSCKAQEWYTESVYEDCGTIEFKTP